MLDESLEMMEISAYSLDWCALISPLSTLAKIDRWVILLEY
jgi:hypothetical protein